MFTGLNQLFTPLPRITEQGEPIQAIRRHDPDYYRGSGRRRNRQEPPLQEYDDISVSIEALSLFLENLLASQKQISEEADTAEISQNVSLRGEDISIAEPKISMAKAAHPFNNASPNARAANAYRLSAEKNAYVSNKTVLPSASTNMLNDKEVHTVHNLLSDLRELKARGVKTIHIRRGKNFLDSLSRAVDQIRHPEHYHD